MERGEWTSFLQLVQELIGGVIRRHTFTQWELELLLDLQTSRIRKSSRPDVLRRYLRTVQQQNGQGALIPARLSNFLAAEVAQREAQIAAAHSTRVAAVRCGD
jgi:hypothetical protein